MFDSIIPVFLGVVEIYLFISGLFIAPLAWALDGVLQLLTGHIDIGLSNLLAAAIAAVVCIAIWGTAVFAVMLPAFAIYAAVRILRTLAWFIWTEMADPRETAV